MVLFKRPLREASRRPGVVLPFYKLGKPLGASFYTSAFGGEKYAKVKEAVSIGTCIGIFQDSLFTSPSNIMQSTKGGLREKGDQEESPIEGAVNDSKLDTLDVPGSYPVRFGSERGN